MRRSKPFEEITKDQAKAELKEPQKMREAERQMAPAEYKRMIRKRVASKGGARKR